jgi:hypothetical protein
MLWETPATLRPNAAKMLNLKAKTIMPVFFDITGIIMFEYVPLNHCTPKEFATYQRKTCSSEVRFVKAIL